MNNKAVKVTIKRNIGGTFTVTFGEKVFTYVLNEVIETRMQMKKDFEGISDKEITQMIEFARRQTSFDNENRSE